MGLSGKEEEEKKKSASSTSPCAHLRAAYNDCFNRWYAEKFVRGELDEQDCADQWLKYRACLSEHLDDKLLARFLESENIPAVLPNQADA